MQRTINAVFRKEEHIADRGMRRNGRKGRGKEGVRKWAEGKT
jgi:hypothetical protein